MYIEPQDKKVRLIVVANGEELACRKAYIKKLQQFLSSDEINIFKGRLQLYKIDHLIGIRCKNKPAGVISAEQFTTLLTA